MPLSLEIWMLACGAACVFIGWRDHTKGLKHRFAIMAAAWLVVVMGAAHVVLKISRNESILRENQEMLREILERVQ